MEKSRSAPPQCLFADMSVYCGFTAIFGTGVTIVFLLNVYLLISSIFIRFLFKNKFHCHHAMTQIFFLKDFSRSLLQSSLSIVAFNLASNRGFSLVYPKTGAKSLI